VRAEAMAFFQANNVCITGRIKSGFLLDALFLML
jgi:hypothetical protein